MTYSQKLKDPRWQKLRLKVFENDDFACTHCFKSSDTLHAHHIAYKPGADPWDYDPSEIITLCETCHESVERSIKRIRVQLSDSFLRYPIQQLSEKLDSESAQVFRFIILGLRDFPELIEPFQQLVKSAIQIQEKKREEYSHTHTHTHGCPGTVPDINTVSGI